MSVTIAVLSQKGGTGKTTTVRSLADVLERVGLDVLAIDADPQGNLSDYFDVDPSAEPTLAEVLGGTAKAVDAVHGKRDPRQPRARRIRTGARREDRPRGDDAKRPARAEAPPRRDPDRLPADAGLLTVNALVASTHAMLSTQAQHFSLQGVEQAMQIFDLARDTLNPELELLGVLLNIANMRTRHARQTLDALEAAIPRQGLRNRDPAVDRLCRSPPSGPVPILDYRPERGADYIDLADEMLTRLGMDDRVRRLEQVRQDTLPQRLFSDPTSMQRVAPL